MAKPNEWQQHRPKANDCILILAAGILMSPGIADDALRGWDAYDANQALATELGYEVTAMARLDWTVPVPERSGLMGHHGGQVSFGSVMCTLFEGTEDESQRLNSLAADAVRGRWDDDPLSALAAGQYVVLPANAESSRAAIGAEIANVRPRAQGEGAAGAWHHRLSQAQALLSKLNAASLDGDDVVSLIGLGMAWLPQSAMSPSQVTISRPVMDWMRITGCTTAMDTHLPKMSFRMALAQSAVSELQAEVPNLVRSHYAVTQTMLATRRFGFAQIGHSTRVDALTFGAPTTEWADSVNRWISDALMTTIPLLPTSEDLQRD